MKECFCVRRLLKFSAVGAGEIVTLMIHNKQKSHLHCGLFMFVLL